MQPTLTSEPARMDTLVLIQKSASFKQSPGAEPAVETQVSNSKRQHCDICAKYSVLGTEFSAKYQLERKQILHRDLSLQMSSYSSWNARPDPTMPYHND